MDTDRTKRSSQWYYSTVFRDEVILPRSASVPERLPSLLRAARSLENSADRGWQSRETVFLNQAKLLAQYEDDYSFSGNVVRYYPTYQSLSDRELRGYFSWRTGLRKGRLTQTSLSFAFLYIYELINQIGVQDPVDGYEKLCDFRDGYGALDGSILPYLERWMTDYAVYYGLDPLLLSDSRQCNMDRNILVLEQIADRTEQEIMGAVKAIAPKWLSRSKFYSSYSADCDPVIVNTLRRIADHYQHRTKKTMTEHYFGKRGQYPLRLFDTAVFCDPLRKQHCVYTLDPLCVYRCENGLWSVTKYPALPCSGRHLEDTLKTIDALMRNAYDYRHPVKQELDTKWLVKIIQEEIDAILQQKKDAEAKKISIDYTKLSKIRQEAAVTQEKLTVEEEAEEEIPYEPAQTAAVENSPLTGAEYKLLQCLLYGRSVEWVRQERHILSVLLDGINDKLYDIFQDTILVDGPEVLEDYMDELKEMVTP